MSPGSFDDAAAAESGSRRPAFRRHSSVDGTGCDDAAESPPVRRAGSYSNMNDDTATRKATFSSKFKLFSPAATSRVSRLASVFNRRKTQKGGVKRRHSNPEQYTEDESAQLIQEKERPLALAQSMPTCASGYTPQGGGIAEEHGGTEERGGRRKSIMERRMSRKARTTFMGRGGVLFQVKNRTHSKVEMMKAWDKQDEAHSRKSDPLELLDSLSSVLLKSLSNKNLCDVEMVGKDGVPVEAPSYILAAHSDVLEKMLHAGESKTGPPPTTSTVDVPFASYDAIDAAIHFLVTRSLPEGLEHVSNEFNIRCICQVYTFGRLFKIPSLKDHAYRIARLLMAKCKSKSSLVCAAFDECNACQRLLSPKYTVTSLDELRAYALNYMREFPLETLLPHGTVFLDANSIDAVVCDQEMDVDEYTMFKILKSWVNVDTCYIETGKKLISNINLCYIKVDRLEHEVRKCGFVDPADVDAAIREIEEMLASQLPDEKEHVLVEGAGKDEVNGIYVRNFDDIGLESDDVVYIKEAPEDVDYPDYGIYLLGSKWSITSCVDYFNVLYSCEVQESDTLVLRHHAPSSGWKAIGGVDPAPRCTWKPSKEEAGEKKYFAPNLAEFGHTKSAMIRANGDYDEGAVARRMTLGKMLNLPTDEIVEDDYYDDIEEHFSGSERDGVLKSYCSSEPLEIMHEETNDSGEKAEDH